jgi:hypothetical protein
MQQFRSPLHVIVTQAKQLIRDWTIFENPLPQPTELLLETMTVLRIAKEAGSDPVTTEKEDQSEYFPPH